ncbi:LuxR C-terminal-related transcriptional regulator [Phenylobacterium sp.]|uniref:LuxR C-terminal-related transcriptional regulator n=1 Tax=Phenylobacterium sp. TaxID=1871053 RepID=UPI002C9C8682|nr:LuxR C-terminal-related transcriptional regulator [Phenylobacterium sp.]HVI30581.1 LuxR C-terminal-related transcriptional regulator [Phenylobacterium sp.]
MLAAALEALPLPAALTTATGEALCANQGLLAVLGASRRSTPAAIRLPLPEGRMGRGGGGPEVRAGRLRVSRVDGAVLHPLVLTVELGYEGCRLCLLADIDAPGPVLDAGMPGELQELDPGAKLDTLTLRERHVLGLLIGGRSNKDVARELGISPRTVEVHRSRVLHKLGARSLTQAFAVAMSAGLAMERVTPRAGAAPTPAGAAYNLQFR